MFGIATTKGVKGAVLMAYKDKMVSVKISEETYKLLQENKKKTGVTIVYTIESAIQDYFKRRDCNE